MSLIWRESTQILVILLIEDVELVIYKSCIFLFKYLLENTFDRITNAIVRAVFHHFINEEKRQALDAFLNNRRSFSK